MADLPPQLWLVDKPSGITSHDVVAAVRRCLKEDGYNVKAGHAGTLDPLASGLLLILIGSATRSQLYFLNSMKKYEYIIQLGQARDSGDSTGQLTGTAAVPPLSVKAVRKVLAKLSGRVVLPVPLYAAAKVDGRKLYEYARRGEEPRRRPLRFCTLANELVDVDNKKKQLSIITTCSAGTYIRSLAEKIAGELGTSGHIISLRRLSSGDFQVKEAVNLVSLFRDSSR